ncbi:MAG: MFS transporter, partial [Caldilineaceae bacterium]|nr:MFS transporter [Caldilineaceae bacterium]
MLKHNPARIYLVIGGGRALFNALVFTINLIYQVQTVGLNPLQMVLVGTVLEVTVLLFEVPTGAVADVYSRRLSVLIGLALVGCGYLLEGSIPLFWAVLGAQVLWGIGFTFLSGALQAWLADEIGAEAAGPVYLRSAQVELITGLAGTGVSVWLARRWLQLPILVGGVMYIALAAFMALIMPEKGFRPTPPEERETWKEMAATAKAGMRAVRDHRALRIVVGLSLVTGLYSEGYDRLWTPHMLDNFRFPSLFGLEDALIWFGIIGVGATLTGIAANELARRGRATEVPARTVNWLTILYGLLAA